MTQPGWPETALLPRSLGLRAGGAKWCSVLLAAKGGCRSGPLTASGGRGLLIISWELK